MQCPRCQTDNLDTRKFCRECGAKLLLVCGKCGSENQPGDKFCGECGHNLQETAETALIDYTAPQSYTPKHLTEKILTTRSSIEGERKLVTVLFADVANYTAMSEKLDPEEVHQIMDGCFNILMEEIHKYEGTINQFTGDGVMALFGAPVAHEDHAWRACKAALAIQKAMGAYGDRIEKDADVQFKMRIGLNSGPVIVGAIGDDLRMDYTAVGDTTNLAARMESLAQPGTVIVTGDTHRLIRDFFELESLGPVEVKGKEKPQDAWRLLRPSDVGTRFEASVAKGLTRFVGRKNSMAALKEAYEKVRSGSGQVVGVVGEAGVGKSRLLLEFRNQITDEFTFLEGRCLQFGGSISFLPVLDILRSYFGLEEGEREFLIKKKLKEKIADLDENLNWTLAPFQDLLSVKVDSEDWLKLEPKEKREKIFEALRNLLIRESHEKIIFLAVDDLHWMDKSTEEFLNFFIDWLPGARILLLLLYRPEYIHLWGNKTYYNRIGLDQLGPGSSIDLIQAILKKGEVAPEIKKLILNRAAGNPLFMEEFTHSLLENGSIEKKGQEYILCGQTSDIQAPDTIQGIIAARMDRLEDNLKRTMQAASVIGKDFAFRLLQSITGTREELKACLLNLQGLEFIYEKQIFPELEYIFKHALTQEVAYNSLLLKRRREIHEKIGWSIEQIYSERLKDYYEMLAYHYSKSDNLDRAQMYLKLSGDKAAASFSNWEAVENYRQALAVLFRMPDKEENKQRQLDVVFSLMSPLTLLGVPDEYFGLIEQGAELARELGDGSRLSHFLSLLGLARALKRGDLPLGIKYVEDSLEEARKLQKVDLMGPIGTDLCMLYNFSGDYLRITALAPEIISLLEKAGLQYESFGRPWNAYSTLQAYYGVALFCTGKFGEAVAWLDKSMDFIRETSDTQSLILLELHYGMLCNSQGRGAEALDHFEKVIKYSEETQTAIYIGTAWIGLGWANYLLGNLQAAGELILKGLAIQDEGVMRFHIAFFHLLLSLVLFESNDPVQARDVAEEALKMAQKHSEKMSESVAWLFWGRALGRVDQSNDRDAERYMRRGLAISGELKTKHHTALGYLFLGEYFSDRDRKAEARENLEKAMLLFEEMDMDFWLNRTREFLKRL